MRAKDCSTTPRSSRSRVRLGGLGAVTLAALVLLGACGRPANPAAASASAALACEELVGVEDTVLRGEVSHAVELQALAAAEQDAEHAARDDARWKRLDTDVTDVHFDILHGRTKTLTAKVTDAAAICSPLATSSTTVP